MNEQEYHAVSEFLQTVLQSKHIEDLTFDPTYKEHPKQSFPDLVYDIVGKIINRFNFIEWDDVEKPDHWIWGLVTDELNKLVNAREYLEEA
jgi:hypothetical protein